MGKMLANNSRKCSKKEQVNARNSSIISCIHMRYVILLLLISACASDQDIENSVAENDDLKPGITVLFESDSGATYTLSKDQTFEESLQKIPYMDTLTIQRDTVFFPLDDDIQLVYGRTPMKFDQKTLLVKTGDTIHIDVENNKADIYKLSWNKREEVQWSDSMIMPDNALRREMEALRSVFIAVESAGEVSFLIPNTKRKDEWSTRLKEYIKVIDKYYDLLVDSLSLIEGKDNTLYIDILRKKQFFEFHSLNDVVNDPGMIVKKNDRDTILKYVNAYKDEFGTVTPLEAILEEIEYGAVEDHDLILQDYLGTEIKW